MAHPLKERREVPFCERCGVPTDYCRFFNHIDGASAPDSAPPVVAAKPDGPDVIITIKSRTKRKTTTTVIKLEDWGITPRDFARQIAKEHNVGCSAKHGQNGWSVEIQGDFQLVLVGILTDARHRIPKRKIQIREERTKESDEASGDGPTPRLLPRAPPPESEWTAEART
jgi:translation initiation factor 1 (eIF-1/SUI1)